MPLCFPIKDHKAIKIADIKSNAKANCSAPILNANNKVEAIAVITPPRSKNLEVFILINPQK